MISKYVLAVLFVAFRPIGTCEDKVLNKSGNVTFCARHASTTLRFLMVDATPCSGWMGSTNRDHQTTELFRHTLSLSAIVEWKKFVYSGTLDTY